MDPFVGEIRVFALNFAPQGWALCNGQLISISSNTALFAILGITYGGDGKSTFALPNLMGLVVPGAGHGPGLSEWDPGQTGGEAQVALRESEMPAHSHLLTALNNTGTASTPGGNLYLAKDVRGGGGIISYMDNSAGVTPNIFMSPSAVMPSGGGQPHENRQPYLALNFCIALTGIFPPRG